MASETSVLAAAAWAGVSVDSACGGHGTCGDCRVRIVEGAVPITPADEQHLSEAERVDGWRLACRAMVRGDVLCEAPELSEHPRAAVEGIGRDIAVEPAVRLETVPTGTAIVCGDHQLDVIEVGSPRGLYGVAFDLGTTTVAGALVDLVEGDVVAATSMVNRQVTAGADVISRAAFARANADGISQLQSMAVQTLNELVLVLCGQAGISSAGVYETVVTGNAIMLHILRGHDPHPLAVAPFEPAFREALDTEAAEIGLAGHRQGRLQTFPIIGTYAGGDTVAGLHATDLVRGDRPRLLIDLGTNTEVGLGWSGRVVVASAPAGPAFEGGSVRCGMPAVRGAIVRVKIGSDVDLEVIGGVAPRGICGSGLVDAVAQLRRAGLLDRTGLLTSKDEAPDHPLADRLNTIDGARVFRLTDNIYLSQLDIRELQSAIAAVAAATRIVMEEEEVDPADLADVFIAGSFGAALDPASARIVGLVPSVSDHVVSSVGNAAIEGAKAALISFRERQVAFQIPSHAEYVELSAHPKFNDTFLDAMKFPDLEALS